MSEQKRSSPTLGQARALLVLCLVCGISAIFVALTGLVRGCFDPRIVLGFAGGVLMGYAVRMRRAMSQRPR